MFASKLGFSAIILTILSYVIQTNGGNVVFCYLGTWAIYRSGNGKFDVDNIDSSLCTHLGYSFFGIRDTGNLLVLDPYLDLEDNYGRGYIKKFNSLKQKNGNLKTLAVVGGWNDGSIKYSTVAADPVKRRRFIDSALDFILYHNFDGLDLDWEYPNQRGGNAEDLINLNIWLKELREEFDKHNLLLTAAVGAAPASAELSYDIPNISKYLDFINLMTYDFHGSWDPVIGINAPLYDDATELSVDSSVNYWLNQGAPPNKLVVGIPFYGKSFTLQDPSKTKPGSPHSGLGEAGIYTAQPGLLGYNEICETTGWTEVWEPKQMVPYAYKGDQWVGFDNERSIAEKGKYVKSKNLAGLMVWSIETDDFRGICGRKYPLLNAVNEALKSPSSGSTTTSITKTTTTTSNPTTKIPSTKSTTTAKPTNGDCKNDGTFVDPSDCSKFYKCINGYRYNFSCPSGLFYDSDMDACNYKELGNCKN